VLGRIPSLGRRDISLFLIDMAAPGITPAPPEHMLGNKTSPTGNIRLEDVAISAQDILAPPGDGLQTIYDVISLDRLLYGVLAAAFLEPVTARLLDFVHERAAFQHPLADYQYIQGRLTDIKFRMETTRWVSYGALDALVRGAPEASLMCSIAKHEAGETLRLGTEQELRILGHAGYMVGDSTRRLTDALGTLIAGGTAEMQRKNVFTQMVQLAR
jgi:isovaleryl-CoA dehydrogenase